MHEHDRILTWQIFANKRVCVCVRLLYSLFCKSTLSVVASDSTEPHYRIASYSTAKWPSILMCTYLRSTHITWMNWTIERTRKKTTKKTKEKKRKIIHLLTLSFVSLLSCTRRDEIVEFVNWTLWDIHRHSFSSLCKTPHSPIAIAPLFQCTYNRLNAQSMIITRTPYVL